MTAQIMSQATGSLPFFTDTLSSTNNTQTQNGSGTEAGSNLNVYSDAQKAAQGQVLNSLTSFMNGGSATTNAGLSDAEKQAAIMDWNQNTAPILTNQLGAGTPALGSSLQQLILNLTAQGNARNVGAFQNGLGQLQNAAFTPQGNVIDRSNTAQGTTTAQGSNHQIETGFDTNAALNMLSQILGGAAQAPIGTVPIPTQLAGAGGP